MPLTMFEVEIYSDCTVEINDGDDVLMHVFGTAHVDAETNEETSYVSMEIITADGSRTRFELAAEDASMLAHEITQAVG